MSSKRIGKRERAARKRKTSMRSMTIGNCSYCTERVTWKHGRKKGFKSFTTKLVCGQCRKVNHTCAGVPS